MRPKVSYKFVSIFNPSSIHNLSLYCSSSISSNNYNNFKMKKVMIKQSYLFIAWLSYNNTKSTSSGFFVLPLKTSLTTKIKSPMAHKTFSQEQFNLKFFQLIYSSRYEESTCFRSNLSYLHTINTLSNNYNLYGTNLLMAYNIKSVMPVCDTKFLQIK